MLGGRFLVLDKRTGIYKDIGDKKATEKTSQALREGQAQVLKDIISQAEKEGESIREGEKMPSEEYFRYSFEMLKSLYHVENNLTAEMEMAQRPAPNSAVTQLQLEIQTAVSG